MKQVVDTAHKLSQDFTKNDYVVILAGSNDALNNKAITLELLTNIKKQLNHTNYKIFTTPFWDNHLDYNSMVLQNNLRMYSTFVNASVLINSGSILTPTDFTKHGLHLNLTGKRKLMENIKFRFIIPSVKIQMNNKQSKSPHMLYGALA